MPLKGIDHITINSADLAQTRAFYVGLLGFTMQKRSSATESGAWLFLGDHPFVHVRNRRAEQAPDTTGFVDHIAFAATDVEATRARLANAGATFRENIRPDLGIHQIVLSDPDGIKVELNFRL